MNRCQRTAVLRRVAIAARRLGYDDTKLRTQDARGLRTLARTLGLTDAGHPKAPGQRRRRRTWKDVLRVHRTAKMQAERRAAKA